MRVADQLEKEDSLRRQIKSAMVYPGVVLTFALTVLIGLVDVPRPGLRRRLRPVRRRPADDHEVHGRPVEQHQGLLVRLDHRHRRPRLGVPQVEEHVPRPRPVGRVPPADPDEDRRHRPEGRAGPLVAHAQRARQRRRPAPRGARHHGADRGQPRRRERDGRRHRVGQARRHDRRPAQGARPSSPAWSATWSAWARRPAPSTRCCRRSRTSTRTRSPRPSSRSPRSSSPIMLVVVGGIVGFIVISMYMPLFKVYDSIK